MDLFIITEQAKEMGRSVYLTNDDWLVLSQCVESFADAYRAQHSQTIATYLTRGQVDIALTEAEKMGKLLQRLDKLQVDIVS
jgi:hypothetical protein